ncbi:MAG: Fe-Mn family superoxide dismutase [Verrucomicrobiota bacterium]|nr:Fe-Mn family superoxide dismutase [Verrucomicrobiota bacterium]
MAYQYVNKQETLLGKVYGKTGKISDRTHEEHLKLYSGYVTRANGILKELEELAGVIDPANAAHANQTYSVMRSLKVELPFAVGGIINHELYFSVLGGTGGKPEGTIYDLITRSFGTAEKFFKDLKVSALCARGWVWTGFDAKTGQLFNYIGDSQNTFPVWGVKPVLALDMYEHAYFADFFTARGVYIDEFIAHLDWNAVNANLL